MERRIPTAMIVALWVARGIPDGMASTQSEAHAAAVAQLKQAELGEIDHAVAALEKAAAGTAGAAVIDAVAPQLDETRRVPLAGTADLIWPGAASNAGHGRYLDYDVDSLAIRAGWVLETLTFRDFGFRGFEIDRDGARAKQASAKFRAWWTKDVAASWTRYRALQAALASTNVAQQAAALAYLRFGTVGCDGLDAARFAADLAPRVAELAKSPDPEIRAQAEMLARDGSPVAGTSNRTTSTTVSIAAGLTFAVPSTWTSVPVKSAMRQAQYRLPAAGASEAPELVVYFFGAGGGGGVEANHARWRGQFQPAEEGSPLAETAAKKKVHGLEIDLLEIAGRYVAETAPGSGQRVDKPNTRMLSAIVPAKQGLVYFKLVGPNDAVLAGRSGFDALIESLVDG